MALWADNEVTWSCRALVSSDMFRDLGLPVLVFGTAHLYGLLGRLLDRLLGRHLGRLLGRLLGHLLGRLLDRLLGRHLGRLLQS